MFTFEKQDLGKNTLKYTVTIPVKEIKTRYDAGFDEIRGSAKIEGFRPGKAPANIAKKHISKEKIYDLLIQKLLPDVYKDILTREKLEPIISPEVELKKAEEEKDWEIDFTIAMKPAAKLPDYKKVIQKVKAELKKDAIWVPGKDVEKESEAEKMKRREKLLDEIVRNLVKETEIELSDLIIEQEVNNRLSKLLDDVRSIGLTMDAYLASKNLTTDSAKAQFKKEVQDSYAVDLILTEIGDKENISVSQKELDDFFEKISDEASKADAKKHAYFYSSVLRKQKIIDFLSDL